MDDVNRQIDERTNSILHINERAKLRGSLIYVVGTKTDFV